MTIPDTHSIYTTLNQTCHQPLPLQMDLFSPHDPNTNNQYWFYSDLHNLFGETYFPTRQTNMATHTWQNISMPTGNKLSPELSRPTSEFYNGHVVQISHAYHLDNHQFKNAMDIKLSRYACWCLSRQNPNLIFARTYFLSPIIRSDMNFSDMKNLSYQFARIHLRQKLSGYERQLAGIINKHNGHFSQFNRGMTLAFFYGFSAETIKEKFHIPIKSNDPIANYMGAASLHAKTAAMHSAIQKFNDMHKQNINIMSEILYNELIAWRTKLIRDFDIRPETDIFRTPASHIQTQMKNTERNFVHEYHKQNIR